MEKKPEVKLAIKPSKEERKETLEHLGGDTEAQPTSPNQPLNQPAVSSTGSQDTFVGSPLPTGAAVNARRDAVEEEQDRTSRPDILPK